MGMLLVLLAFSHKPKDWISKKFDDGARWKVRGWQKLFQIILTGTWMSEPNFVAILKIVLQTFRSKPQMSTSWWCWRKRQRISKVCRIHSPGIMNVFTKLCWDISVWAKVVDWTTARQTNIAIHRAMLLAWLLESFSRATEDVMQTAFTNREVLYKVDV